MPKENQTTEPRPFADVFVQFLELAVEYVQHPATPASGREAVRSLVDRIRDQLKSDIRPHAPADVKPAPKPPRASRFVWPRHLDV